MGLLFLANLVSAYHVTINAPDSLAIGKPLVVTGTTTFGIGTPIDIVLYHQVTTTTEIQRKIVYIQPDQSFQAVFDTSDLTPGTYKVEAPPTANGDSVTTHLVTLYDRSEEISLSSPMIQTYTGNLYLNGEITGKQNSGVQVEVIDPAGLVIFGPRYINTDNAAHFAADIPIREPGSYEVSFTDGDGYIGSQVVTILGGDASSPSGTPGISKPTQVIVLSAQSQSSRDAPAYFMVKTNVGPVVLYTSKSTDWVMEYIDDQGVLYTENDRGGASPERAEFTGKGTTVYVKIYPYKYASTSEVTLYGENVKAVVVSPSVPVPFALSVVKETTPTTPLAPGIAVISMGIALCLLARRKN
jgi:hypothetical protein